MLGLLRGACGYADAACQLTQTSFSMKLRHTLFAGSLLLGSIAGVTHSDAASIVQVKTIDSSIIYASGSFSGTTSEVISGIFPDYSFDFDQFDSSLGTLTSVTIESEFIFSLSATVGAGGSAGLQMTTGTSYLLGGGAITGGGNGGGLTSSVEGEVINQSVTISLNESAVTPSRWNDLGIEGTGTIEGEIVTSAPSGHNYQFTGYFTDYNVQLDSGSSFTVTYNYTAVPEPSSSALALLAGCGVIFIRRRS